MSSNKRNSTEPHHQGICIISYDTYGYYTSNEELAGGGAQRQLYLLSRSLANYFNVDVVVGDFGQNIEFDHENISLYKGGKPFESVSGVDKYKQLLRVYKTIYDIGDPVYIFRGFPKKMITYGLIVRLMGKKYVYHVANDHYLERPDQVLGGVEKKLFRRFLQYSTVISQTKKQKNLLRSQFGVESTIIPNGYPTSDTTPQYPGKYFLWVGRIDQDQKQPHIYLDVAEEVDDQFILIGGESGDEKYYEKIANRAEEIENVQFIGAVAPDEIHQYYSDAKALINTSNFEGFPNTFLEAWRQGTPVISLNVNPKRFLGQDGSPHYANGNFQSLIQNIKALKNEKVQRQSGMMSKKIFENKYSIESIADKYERVLAEEL